MRINFLFIFLSVFNFSIGGVLAQESYEFYINDSLKKKAAAVIWFDNTVCELKDNGLKTKHTYRITILDESGLYLNSFAEFYNDRKKIVSVKAKELDYFGKVVKKYRRSDFRDYSAANSFSLYEDQRVLAFKPFTNKVPYTIEYEYETFTKEFLGFPIWIPVPAPNVSCAKSEYTLILPKDYEVNIQELNLPEKALIIEDDKNKTIKLKLSNYQAMKEEPLSPGFEKYLPLARLVPGKFQLEDYEGSFNSWKDFGEWAHDLIKDRNQLPPEAEQEILKEIEGLETKQEKVKALYKYLQSTTRYVSIQLGIGGYQPFPASEVYEKGYGDCKALSNYMKSMLEVAGIESYYSLVYGGNPRREIFTDFPNQQFNHAILFVPLEEDTIWLECTSQTNPFGYLGSFTDDRLALVIEKNNSRLVRTKSYSCDDNLLNRNARVSIDMDNQSVRAQVSTIYTGKQYSEVDELIYKSRNDQKEDLLRDIDISDFSINDFQISTQKAAPVPEGIINLDVTAEKYFTRAGDLIFLPLNLMHKSEYVPDALPERKNLVFLNYNYSDTDTIIYDLPDGYRVEYLPEDIQIDQPFGSYHMSVKSDGKKITYIRKKVQKKGLYEPEIYNSLREFYEDIRKADQIKVMLKKTV